MKMGSFLSMWIVFSLMSGVGCIGDIELLTDRIYFLEKGMGLLDNRISLDKADILKKQDKKILSLKTELKTDVQQHVAETLASILRSESIEGIIKSEVNYEVRHLKLANKQMRRELHKMKTSFGQIQVENRMFRDALKKVERSEGDLVTCSKCPTFELLKGELAERDQTLEELNSKIKELNNSYIKSSDINMEESDSLSECSKCLNSKIMTNRLIMYDRQINELNQTVMEENKLCKTSNNTANKGIRSLFETSTTITLIEATEQTTTHSPSRVSLTTTTHSPSIVSLTTTTHSPSIVSLTTTTHSPSIVSLTTTTHLPSTVSLTTTTHSPSTVSLTTTTHSPSTVSLTATTLTTRQTTSEPPAEMSRILIAPLFSSKNHQFRYVNINSNSLYIYSHLNLIYVISVVYISKLNSLLIGLREPDKIISSELNSSRVQTVRRNVRTYGMAADEERGIIFLTTNRPSKTISRMTLQGKNFTTLVSLVRYSGWPLAIVVNPGTGMIFASNEYKLFSVSYNGSSLTILDTGSYMYAVTLDITQGVLYYGEGYTLFKKSLASNKTTEVTRLSGYMWNLIYYRDRVYYSSYGRSAGIFGEVIAGQGMAATTLQTVEVNGVHDYAICLIP